MLLREDDYKNKTLPISIEKGMYYVCVLENDVKHALTWELIKDMPDPLLVPICMRVVDEKFITLWGRNDRSFPIGKLIGIFESDDPISELVKAREWIRVETKPPPPPPPSQSKPVDPLGTSFHSLVS